MLSQFVNCLLQQIIYRLVIVVINSIVVIIKECRWAPNIDIVEDINHSFHDIRHMLHGVEEKRNRSSQQITYTVAW